MSCGGSSVTVGTTPPASYEVLGTGRAGRHEIEVRPARPPLLPTTEDAQTIPDGPWTSVTLVSSGG